MEIEKTTLEQEPEIKMPSINSSIFDKIPKVGNTTEEVIADDKPVDDLDADLKVEDKTKEEDKTETKVEDDKSKETKVEDDNIVSYFKSQYGEDIEGEFDDSLDGIKVYFDKVLEKEKASSLVEGQEELLEKTPILKQLKEHLDAGYAINSFLQQQNTIDFDAIVFKDKDGVENEELAEQVFREARRVRGDSVEEIQDAFEAAKDKGVLLDRAETAKKYLKGIQDKQIEDQKTREKTQNDAIKKQETEFLVEAEKVLKSGNIHGVVVPVEKIKELRKFSFEEDKKGQTERDRKIAGLTVEQGLLLDLILMDDFKALGVKPKAAQVTVNTFKKLKDEIAAKKKPDLSNEGLGSTEKNNINVKSIFNN